MPFPKLVLSKDLYHCRLRCRHRSFKTNVLLSFRKTMKFVLMVVNCLAGSQKGMISQWFSKTLGGSLNYRPLALQIALSSSRASFTSSVF